MDVAAGCLNLTHRLFPGRIGLEQWIRYRVDLSPPGLRCDPTVRLQPVTPEIIDLVRRHPDHDANQLKSGLKFLHVADPENTAGAGPAQPALVA